MSDQYTFNDEGSRRIVNAVRFVETLSRSRPQQRSRYPLPGSGTILVKLIDDLPALTGSTPGQVDATVQTFDGTSYSDTDQTIKLYNHLPILISQSTSQYVFAQVVYGYWHFVNCMCSS